eukprot:c13915_g1_i2.p2 GENE.c13915_g1_i2~~c13915_g1_i2.p2  ORF type:complete len:168 (+),score=19.58 c13915_g1_i2:239-742(+)
MHLHLRKTFTGHDNQHPKRENLEQFGLDSEPGWGSGKEGGNQMQELRPEPTRRQHGKLTCNNRNLPPRPRLVHHLSAAPSFDSTQQRHSQPNHAASTNNAKAWMHFRWNASFVGLSKMALQVFSNTSKNLLVDAHALSPTRVTRFQPSQRQLLRTTTFLFVVRSGGS